MSPGNRHNSPWIQQRTCWSYSHTTTRCRDGVTALLLLLSYNTDTGNGNRTKKHREKWSLPSCASPHPGSHSAGRLIKPFLRVGMDELCVLPSLELGDPSHCLPTFPSCWDVWDEHKDLCETEIGKGGKNTKPRRIWHGLGFLVFRTLEPNEPSSIQSPTFQPDFFQRKEGLGLPGASRTALN